MGDASADGDRGDSTSKQGREALPPSTRAVSPLITRGRLLPSQIAARKTRGESDTSPGKEMTRQEQWKVFSKDHGAGAWKERVSKEQTAAQGPAHSGRRGYEFAH